MELSKEQIKFLMNNKLDLFFKKSFFFLKLIATLNISHDAVCKRLAISGMVLKENINMFAELLKYRSLIIKAICFVWQLWYYPTLNFPSYFKYFKDEVAKSLSISCMTTILSACRILVILS